MKKSEMFDLKLFGFMFKKWRRAYGPETVN